ncbi:MAG: hypothetical protein ACTSQI_18960 [Candidatus Helarchaeota archaeon]
MEVKINTDGVTEYCRYYNGTESGWDLVYAIELQGESTSPIPGFPIESVILLLAIFIGIYVLVDKREKRLWSN